MSTAEVATEGSRESVCLCVCLPSHRERRVYELCNCHLED